jgi:substrate import-associated zinc metallohydrolase lipoprotein
MKKNLLICFLLLTAITISCSREDKLNLALNGLGGDTWERTALDNWLYDSLTAPFNIELKYKWDQSEYDMAYTLVPPREEKVIPVAQALRKLWIETYNQEAGTDLFMKTYAPKQVVLSGSPALNSDGTAVQGLAEGGLKILLFDINSFDRKNHTLVNSMTHLLHHEFTHILNQKKAYPVEFNHITAGDYTSGWTVAREDPLTLGFVSNYARKDPGEDFAEIVAYMLKMGKEGYEEYLNTVPDNEDGIQKLRKKEALVVQYFRETYKLDFYSLQARVQLARKALTD